VTRPHPKALGKSVDALAKHDNVPSRRMRRWVATIALAQVLLGARDRRVIRGFVIKGGHALELRLRRSARASRDVDVIIDAPDQPNVVDALRAALAQGWSGFTFAFREVEATRHAFRFPMSANYGNADWSTFEVEVMAGDVTDEELVDPLDLAELDLEHPEPIPCLDLYAQIAQKFHGATDPDENRPRDLLDLYVLRQTYVFDIDRLGVAVYELFVQRNRQSWPVQIGLRSGWEAEISALISRNTFNCTVAEVLGVVRAFALEITRAKPG